MYLISSEIFEQRFSNSLKLFNTEENYYIYFRATNKIVKISKSIWIQIDYLLNKATPSDIKIANKLNMNDTLKSIYRLLDSNTGNNDFGFETFTSPKQIRKVLNNSMKSIILDLTSNCNLRCKYCSINDIDDNSKIDITTAKSAIDFLNDHSNDREELVIGFYGGEPLLEFDLIKSCVSYAKKAINNKRITFGIATNATLIDKTKAQYLIENSFDILLSLDGPKEINDNWRVNQKDIGQFSSALKGIVNICNYHKLLLKGEITINIVFTPPYSFEKLEFISNFFENSGFSEEIEYTINYPKEGSIKGIHYDYSFVLMNWAFTQYKNNYPKLSVLAKAVFKKYFDKIIQRNVFSSPYSKYPLNGCCLPGYNKTGIDVKGNIKICEIIDKNLPKIGNVSRGFDYETINNFFISEYSAKSFSDCQNCWAARLCDLCYVHAYDSKGCFDLIRKGEHCKFKKMEIHESLKKIMFLNEKQPDIINDLEIKL
jgi:uncharacterized protein